MMSCDGALVGFRYRNDDYLVGNNNELFAMIMFIYLAGSYDFRCCHAEKINIFSVILVFFFLTGSTNGLQYHRNGNTAYMEALDRIHTCNVEMASEYT